ncbi:MAG: serine/threonine protein kinase, partial [Okeania sp. SIO2C9]|nr:serine/threonine protein kinase [Okeania sp. SIO2C9]
ELTRSSDLYSLGATLICLLTGIKSGDIGNLIDANYRIIFRHLIPPLQRGWINWLEKMVEPKPTDRYENAKKALAALQPLDVNRLPKVRISQTNLELASDKWGEKLTGIIEISNPIPQTTLSGRWEVAPHVNDPPHTPYDHSWISFSSRKFEGNNVECEITVDTSKLVENEIHKREIFLHNNSASEIQKINIQVETGSLPKLEVDSILGFFFCRLVVAMLVFCIFDSSKFHPLFIWWAVISIVLCALVNYINNNTVISIITFGVFSIVTFVLILLFFYDEAELMYLLAILSVLLLRATITFIIVVVISYFLARLYLFIWAETIKLIIISKNKIGQSIGQLLSKKEKRFILILTIGLEFSLVITFKIFSEVITKPHCFTLGEILVLAIVAIASLCITLIPLIYLISKPMRIVYKYRKAEPNLIKT